jgi:hypothetical protein
MDTGPEKPASVWRLILIGAEITVLGYLLASFIAGPKARVDVGVFLSVIIFAACLFLLLGSPFLVRSQRWLAILGWCIAASAFLFPVL